MTNTPTAPKYCYEGILSTKDAMTVAQELTGRAHLDEGLCVVDCERHSRMAEAWKVTVRIQPALLDIVFFDIYGQKHIHNLYERIDLYLYARRYGLRRKEK